MALATHLDNLIINITLGTSPVPRAGFGNVLLLVDQAAGTGNGLGGARHKVYTSAAQAQTDQTAGLITTTTLAAVTALFAQRPRPSKIVVGRVDTGGSETYVTGYAAVKVATQDFYVVCADTRTASVQAALAAVVEAERRILIVQSGESSWLDAGVPTGFSAIASNERTGVVYHDAAAAWSDVAWAGGRLAFDPDTTSAPWHYAALKGVASYTTQPTQAQKDALDANKCNHGLVLGGETFVIDPGVSLAGRPLYEIMTADWFEARLEERLTQLLLDHSARGEKLTVDIVGQTKVLAEIQALIAQGRTAGHFDPDPANSRIVGETITTSDRTAQTLRFSGDVTLAVGARKLTVNLNFGTTPLSEA